MKIVIELDEEQLLQLVKPVVKEIVPLIQQQRSDFHLNKAELIKKLKTNPNDVDRLYINRPDFPKFQPEDGADWRFSDVETDVWMSKRHKQNL